MHSAEKYVVGKGYFETTGIPILQGREFDKQDVSGASIAVIVNKALVKQYWKEENPIGRRIEIANGDIVPARGAVPGTIDYRAETITHTSRVFQVRGVAKDVQQGLGIQKPRPAIYFPLRTSDYARPSLQGVTLIVRTVPGADVLRAVRREVSAMDSRLTIFNARSIVEEIGQTLFIVRVAAWTYGFIGLCGLILACVGLAGVTAYSVARRTREIGIRMALGAQKRDVLRLVMKEGANLVITGTLIGLALSWALMRVLASVFASVASSTATVAYGRMLIVGAPLLLAAIALLACYLPARKSVHVDPLLALRQE